MLSLNFAFFFLGVVEEGAAEVQTGDVVRWGKLVALKLISPIDWNFQNEAFFFFFCTKTSQNSMFMIQCFVGFIVQQCVVLYYVVKNKILKNLSVIPYLCITTNDVWYDLTVAAVMTQLLSFEAPVTLHPVPFP